MKKGGRTILSHSLMVASFLLAGCGTTSKDTYPETIVNGGFESSVIENIPNWNAKGLGAFAYENVTRASQVNGVDVLKEGEYFFSGMESSLPSYTGSLESDYFLLSGLGEIAFKMGAGKDVSKIYVQFFLKDSEEPLRFKANGGEVFVDRIGNEDFNGTTITDQMIQKYVDLSEYLDQVIKIVITDNDTNSEITDYSYINIDDFKIIQNASERNAVMQKRSEELEQFKEEPFDEDEKTTTLRNGGFELGDFTGWKVLSGNALTVDHIDNADTKFWGTRLFHAEGQYFLNGFKYDNQEENIGKIRSEKFTILDTEENVYASFRIGGAKHATAYVSVIDAATNSEIVRVTNKEFKDPEMSLNMHQVFVDLSAYKGKVLYFTIHDETENDGGFRSIVVDDFQINLKEEEVLEMISALRTATYEEDEVAGSYYQALYNGGYSFPIKGEAPRLEGGNEFAYETKMLPTNHVNLYSFFNHIQAVDDYTAKQDLRYQFLAIKHDEQSLDLESYDDFDFVEEGNYYITFSVSDAYEQSAQGVIKVVIDRSLVYDATIENGGFETGDLTGWTVISGNVDTAHAISQESVYWAEQIPFNKSGTYFFNGWDATSEESATYSLRSTTFQLGGSGYISFKLGGRSSALRVYTADGTMIADYRNELFKDENFPSISRGSRLATMNGYVADLRSYLGQALYIEIADLSLGNENWQFAYFDEIQTYYETEPIAENMKDTVQEYLMSDNTYIDVDLYYSEAHNLL